MDCCESRVARCTIFLYLHLALHNLEFGHLVKEPHLLEVVVDRRDTHRALWMVIIIRMEQHSFIVHIEAVSVSCICLLSSLSFPPVIVGRFSFRFLFRSSLLFLLRYLFLFFLGFCLFLFLRCLLLLFLRYLFLFFCRGLFLLLLWGLRLLFFCLLVRFHRSFGCYDM